MEKPLRVFCCYAREDNDLLIDLKKGLNRLQREGLISFYADIDITPGENWEQAINQHLAAAHMILLLISPDFMGSEYCYSKEMSQALERHRKGTAHIIPIIVRPTDWQGAPFHAIQALPANALPVTMWSNRCVGALAKSIGAM